MISLQRIRGLLRQEWHISRRSLEIIMDVPFFAAIGILLFGYVSVGIFGTVDRMTGINLLLGALLWEVVRISQYCMTVNSFWNVWSRNLCNIFISPVSLTEYLLAQMASGVVKAGVVLFGLLVPIAAYVFHFNIFSLGATYIIIVFFNLVFFSWSVGLVLLGCVFRYGTRVQALGWALIFIFQPLCAVFFPVSVLPTFLQRVALLFPITYVFEGARATLLLGAPVWWWQGMAAILNVFYFSVSLWLFQLLLSRAKDSGQFARNES